MWLSNTWRALVPLQGSGWIPRVSRREYLWNAKPDEVFQEIANLLGCAEANTYTPGWFEKRGTAIANIYSRMNEVEKRNLEIEMDGARQKGYSQEVQRRCVQL